MRVVERLRENLHAVRERISVAARRAGRSPADVRLVAVSKYVNADAVRQLAQLGCVDFGESRPQMLWEKQAALADQNISWHLVGPLQRNKIRRTLPLVTWIHSIDSFRLADAIDRIAQELNASIDVLLEVNVSHEPTKQGLAIEAVDQELERMASLKRIRVRGFMCMSGLQSDAAQKRTEFSLLRQLRDRQQRLAPQANQLTELSMGMSDDFDIAVEEGATMVRVGSILWEGVAAH